MLDENVLEKVCQERLIAYLAHVKNCLIEIHQGKDGIQYLDYKVLVQIPVETEW